LVTALSLHEILRIILKNINAPVCALELTNDEKGNKTYLTPELKEINDTLKVFCRKKHIQHI
jgi:hypothetical protein